MGVLFWIGLLYITLLFGQTNVYASTKVLAVVHIGFFSFTVDEPFASLYLDASLKIALFLFDACVFSQFCIIHVTLLDLV